jgi:hypothetical protein
VACCLPNSKGENIDEGDLVFLCETIQQSLYSLPKYRIHPIEIAILADYPPDCAEDVDQTVDRGCGGYERVNPKSIFSGVYRSHLRGIGKEVGRGEKVGKDLCR